jgi:O-antigen/teichoic acid export membrane protein
MATGLSVALTSVCVPPVLSRTLSPLQFGAWALVLQFAGYVSVLDLGIQVAVGRYVAYYLADFKRKVAEDFVSTAFSILCISSLIGLAVLAASDAYLRALFPQIPHGLLVPARITLGMVGLGMSLALPASAFRGILTGIERYELVTFIAAPAGLLLSLALITVALTGHGIIALGVTFVTVKLLSYGSYWWVAHIYGRLKVTPWFIDREAAKELWSYCSTSMIWSIGMLMVSGLDVAIVARVDFARVAAYAACVTPITLVAGAQNAMFRPLLQVGSRLFATRDMNGLHALLERSTRVCLITIVLSAAPVFLFSHQILTLWLGKTYADQATLILRLLLIGQAIRLVSTPYATLLLATNNHRVARLPALAEAFSNTAAAVLLGIKFGADGVACGVIVGAIVGQAMCVFYNYPKTREVVGDGRFLVRKAIVVPLMCFIPIAFILPVEASPASVTLQVAVAVVCAAASFLAIWRYSMDVPERQWLLNVMSRLRLPVNT